MPIAWQVSDGDRIDIVFSNPYTIAESERVMNEVFATLRLTRPLRFLVDVRHSAPPDLDFVSNAITFWQLHVNDMWGAKVAIVTANAQQVGMGQMSERTAEARQLPFTLRVFDDSEWDEARQWLGQR